MNRDPRYARMQDPKPSEQQKEPKQPPQQQPFRQPDPLPVDDAEKEKEKRILEMDLSIFGALELPAFKETEPEDDEEEDRMGLPSSLIVFSRSPKKSTLQFTRIQFWSTSFTRLS